MEVQKLAKQRSQGILRSPENASRDHSLTKLLRGLSMSIEDYKRHLDTTALHSDERLSPFWELLERLFDMVVRLDREAYHGVDSDHRAGDIGGYSNGYIPVGATNASG